jgi:small subunit ribosomal protein S17
MQKTVVVAIESHKRHPLYNKTIRRTTRYKVHDAHDLAKVGDIVRIVESRPISREKRWRLAEVVTRREVAEIAPREIDASMLGITRPHTESAAATAEAPVTEAAKTPVEEEAPAEEPASPAAEAVEAPVTEAAKPPVEEEAPPAESEPEAAPVESEAEPGTVAEQEEEQTEE